MIVRKIARYSARMRGGCVSVKDMYMQKSILSFIYFEFRMDRKKKFPCKLEQVKILNNPTVFLSMLFYFDRCIESHQKRKINTCSLFMLKQQDVTCILSVLININWIKFININ